MKGPPLRSLALVLGSLAACRPAGGSSTAAILVDDAGDHVRLGAPPGRIVSLNPTTTQLLFTLGAGPRLVGRSSACDYPAGEGAVPSVGGGFQPAVEAVVGTRPDLVVLYHSFRQRRGRFHRGPDGGGAGGRTRRRAGLHQALLHPAPRLGPARHHARRRQLRERAGGAGRLPQRLRRHTLPFRSGVAGGHCRAQLGGGASGRQRDPRPRAPARVASPAGGAGRPAPPAHRIVVQPPQSPCPAAARALRARLAALTADSISGVPR